MSMTNAQLWNYLRDHNTNFKNITAKATADLFTTKGFEALSRNNINALNDFFTLSMRVAFQKVNAATVRNRLADIGLVERYETPNGGYVQRMVIHSLKPTSPLYKNLADGSSVDAWKVRKPKANEYFFSQNFDYQSYVTLQDFQIKTIFISEYGMSEFVAGVMKSLANSYISQSYANTLECLATAIGSSNHPLKDSQIITLSSWTDAGVTAAELKELVLQLKNVATMIETSPSTDAFNAASFETSYEPEDFVVLMRAGIRNMIDVNVELGAYNPDRLSIPFEVHEVQNFGGLVPYYMKDVEGTPTKTAVYPMYSSTTGEMIGYSETADQTGTTPDLTVEDDGVFFEDPYEGVLAVIAQKGLIFENIQNPYAVVPAPYNPAGLYTTYWASSPNNAIVTDYTYGLICVTKPSANLGSRKIEKKASKN